MTLGFLALNFPGCTDSSRTAVILRQKKISGATMENPLSPSQSAPFEDFAWWGYVSSTDRQPPPSVATWNFAAPQDLRREVSQLQREESKQLQAKQLLEKAPKKMSKITGGAGKKNRMELLPLPFSRFSTCIINTQKARCVVGFWKFQLFRNLALQDIEHLRRALKQRRNAEKERLGSKVWEVAG